VSAPEVSSYGVCPLSSHLINTLPLPEFAHGKVDPVEAGKQGGKTSGTTGGSDDSDATGGDYKPTEHGGLTKDGKPDGRVKGN